MNKRQRFEAAVSGAEVDHPPCVVWVHFVTDALPPEEAARRHATWVRTYDWDIAKVMHDYRYPLPDGLETINTPADMMRFTPQPPTIPNYAKQLDLIRALRRELGPDVPIVDTYFDPFQQVVRSAGMNKSSLIYANKREALHMLNAVTESVCGYMQELKKAGCDGVLYSINGAIAPPGERGVDDETFNTFLKPFDLRVCEAMAGMTRILHVHGTYVDMKRVLDYPVEVFSVSDRLKGNPTLAELRTMTNKCLMGGINESRIQERSAPEIREEMWDAFKQAGKNNFIISPGCTSAPQTPERILRCVRDTSRALQ